MHIDLLKLDGSFDGENLEQEIERHLNGLAQQMLNEAYGDTAKVTVVFQMDHLGDGMFRVSGDVSASRLKKIRRGALMSKKDDGVLEFKQEQKDLGELWNQGMPRESAQ